MSIRTFAEIAFGCLIGTALAAALSYGIVELADWMVEVTDELSKTR